MKAPSAATFSKIIGIAVLLCGAVWNAFGQPQDRTKAAELVGMAAALAGIGRKQVVAEQKQDEILANQEVIKADTQDIRLNPALPGTPPPHVDP